MRAGQIVIIDWRDALAESDEPNKSRPAVIVSAPPTFGTKLRFELVVPLTGEAAFALPNAALGIAPTAENGCTKPSVAVSWSVQAVPHSRIVRETPSRVTDEQLAVIRHQIARCIGIDATQTVA